MTKNNITINGKYVYNLFEKNVEVLPIPRGIEQYYQRLRHLSGGELLSAAYSLREVIKASKTIEYDMFNPVEAVNYLTK